MGSSTYRRCSCSLTESIHALRAGAEKQDQISREWKDAEILSEIPLTIVHLEVCPSCQPRQLYRTQPAAPLHAAYLLTELHQYESCCNRKDGNGCVGR